MPDIGLFGKYIDFFLASVDVGFRKPNPAGYLMLADELGADPAHMMYVGNEEKDIIGANDAGMISVLIRREKCGKNISLHQPANLVIEDLTSLKRIVMRYEIS